MWKYLFWIIILDSNRKSPGTSSKSGSNKNRTSPPNNKTGYGNGNGNKVSVTVALDQDVSIMSDLPDYKKELQRLNTIIGKSNTSRAKKVTLQISTNFTNFFLVSNSNFTQFF